ncbi:hypothetical protein DXG03_002500 [Asterophora parasitica]|uniref:Uncharacterized protein n=1 Tax=Asterophora parasitica TaxID=117018 RepID=A0A9P7G1Y7_9AGAR|nr:hypothetical protein DXG03_002500 [Asterophora parasitica]
MSLAFTRLTQQKHVAVKEGVAIVRRILARKALPTGYTTQELYKLTLKEAPSAVYEAPERHILPTAPKYTTGGEVLSRTPPPAPPNPNHPVRSIKFLKRDILPVLEGQKELYKTRTERIPQHAKKSKDTAPSPTQTVWVWLPIPFAQRPKPPIPEAPKEVFGVDLGVGEDLSHLSKRRERSRRAKIRRDVHAAKVAAGMKRDRERSRQGAELRGKQALEKKKAERSAGDVAEVGRVVN